MSTVAEYLAMLELYRSRGRAGDEGFYNEAYLFTQTHWRELIALVGPEDMTAARQEIEALVHQQHPQKAEEIISHWLKAVQEGA